MYLTNLTDETIKVCKTDNKRLKLSGISSNSRSIKKGMLFAVVKGDKKNINKYVLDAFKLGAKAVLCRKSDVNNLNKNIKNILISEDVRLAVAKIASDFFPYQPRYITAITGTNGKTSVVNFLYEIWKKK